MKTTVDTIRFQVTVELGATGRTNVPAVPRTSPSRYVPMLDGGKDEVVDFILERLTFHNQSRSNLPEFKAWGVEVAETCDFHDFSGSRGSIAGNASLWVEVPTDKFSVALIERVRVVVDEFFRDNLCQSSRRARA